MLQVQNIRSQKILGTQIRCAQSFRDRLIGLLSTKELPHNKGLWITPCRSIHTFFMKFSIDVLFLSDQMEVIKMHSNMKPFRITPCYSKAKTVLELPSGTIHSSQTQLGDILSITNTSQKQDGRKS